MPTRTEMNVKTGQLTTVEMTLEEIAAAQARTDLEKTKPKIRPTLDIVVDYILTKPDAPIELKGK